MYPGVDDHQTLILLSSSYPRVYTASSWISDAPRLAQSEQESGSSTALAPVRRQNIVAAAFLEAKVRSEAWGLKT